MTDGRVCQRIFFNFFWPLRIQIGEPLLMAGADAFKVRRKTPKGTDLFAAIKI
jgi:hypothetical protein